MKFCYVCGNTEDLSMSCVKGTQLFPDPSLDKDYIIILCNQCMDKWTNVFNLLEVIKVSHDVNFTSHQLVRHKKGTNTDEQMQRWMFYALLISSYNTTHHVPMPSLLFVNYEEKLYTNTAGMFPVVKLYRNTHIATWVRLTRTVFATNYDIQLTRDPEVKAIYKEYLYVNHLKSNNISYCPRDVHYCLFLRGEQMQVGYSFAFTGTTLEEYIQSYYTGNTKKPPVPLETIIAQIEDLYSQIYELSHTMDHGVPVCHPHFIGVCFFSVS